MSKLEMQIVIPMSGFGERFRTEGYDVPKPLIEIDGKPMIAYVIDMFPGEKNFIFICNEDHLRNPVYRMREILDEYCPGGKAIGIPYHKLGPVHAVLQIEHLLCPNSPTVINYCDFTCYWDWAHFKEFVQNCSCDGAIPAYKGFHPHSLGSTNYAYLREDGGWMLDIQEKQPFTDCRMDEYASSGTYYFSSGRVMTEALRETTRRGLNVNGEYYVSLAYKPLLDANRAIAVYPLQHFMQWGTPEDVAEYLEWSGLFRRLVEPGRPPEFAVGTAIVPMAGMGKRFTDEGYAVTKPLIPVSGLPMVLQAVHDLPLARQHAFVLRKEMPGHDEIVEVIKQAHPEAVVESIPKVTEGQAHTALIGLDALERWGGVAEPITFGACDNGALYSYETFRTLLGNPNVDVIVWGVRGHATAVRHPHMFGWIDATLDGRIELTSVKRPLSSPKSDPIVLGTFTFKRAADFRKAVARLIARDGRINGEFYIDACINDAIDMGLRCHLFEVDHVVSWGTPNDLHTFEYWQSCFHKWGNHPYHLARDGRIPKAQIGLLESRYQATIPVLPRLLHD